MAEFKMTSDGLYYDFYGVCDTIDPNYACSERIDAYLDDEYFQTLVINSYSRINLNNENDCSRVLAKMTRVGCWLKQKIASCEKKEK